MSSFIAHNNALPLCSQNSFQHREQKSYFSFSLHSFFFNFYFYHKRNKNLFSTEKRISCFSLSLLSFFFFKFYCFYKHICSINYTILEFKQSKTHRTEFQAKPLHFYGKTSASKSLPPFTIPREKEKVEGIKKHQFFSKDIIKLQQDWNNTTGILHCKHWLQKKFYYHFSYLLEARNCFSHNQKCKAHSGAMSSMDKVQNEAHASSKVIARNTKIYSEKT